MRPTASTRKYVNADTDPQQAGPRVACGQCGHRALHAPGQPTPGNAAVRECRDSTSVSWQSAPITAPSQDFIALQDDCQQAGAQRIVARAWFRALSSSKPARPRRIRKLTISTCAARPFRMMRSQTSRPFPCSSARSALTRAMRRHGRRLGIRYYFDSQYSSGGEETFQKSNSSCERALALDPNLILAASQLITNRVERGDLSKAYQSGAHVGEATSAKRAGALHARLCGSDTPGCSKNRAASVMLLCGSIRGTICSAPAP